jgi:hypothetical protein
VSYERLKEEIRKYWSSVTEAKKKKRLLPKEKDVLRSMELTAKANP